MRKEVIKKWVLKYTFKHQKAVGGSDHLGNCDFIMPNGDGIEERRLIKRLPEGHIITVTIITEEDA